MDEAAFLSNVSREALITLVTEQQARIIELSGTIVEQRTVIDELLEGVRSLESRLGPGGPTGMPGNKMTPAKSGPRHTVRKPREHAFVRPRSASTVIEQHTVDRCPDCQCAMVGGWVKWTREVIEIPLPAPVITEHQFFERECPLCRKRFTPTDDLVGIVVGKQRLGIGLVSLMATLREEARLPIRTIQKLLSVLWQVPVSVGTVVNAAFSVAAAGTATVAEVHERIRGKPFICADETGLREDGNNGYVWTLCTELERYFVYGRRTRAMAEWLLGPNFTGVLVTDFFASYNFYQGLHQRCWAHLLREIHTLVLSHPTDVRVGRWARAVHRVYLRACAFTSEKEAERLAMQDRCEQALLTISRSLAADPAPVGKLARRIERFIAELFTFVAIPGVPSTNNAAERSLRHFVTSRKISGGTRSPKGTATKMRLSTLFGTWRVLGLNPFDECRKLLTSASPLLSLTPAEFVPSKV